MIIRRIDIENFLSHDRSLIEFKGTVNVIIGHNGAGKSSIIDAISFSLFRKSLRDAKKQEDLIKRGAGRATVTLYLENKGKIYVIKRNAPNQYTSEDTISELTNDTRRTIARGATTVSQKIKELLNLDEEVLKSTIIVGQGKIESVFENLPDVTKKILKIDKIEKLRDSNGPIKEVMDKINNKIIELQSLEKYKNESENQKIQKEKELENIKRELEDLNIKEEKERKKYEDIVKLNEEEEKKEKRYVELISLLNKLKDDISELREEVKDENRLREEKEKLEKDILEKDKLIEEKEKIIEAQNKIKLAQEKEKSLKTIKINLTDLEEKLKRKRELEEDYKKYIEIKGELEELEEKERKFNSLSDRLKSLKIKLSEIESKISNRKISINIEELDKELQKLNEDLNNKNQEREKLASQLGEIKGRIEELNKLLGNLNQVKGNVCPVCGRELSDDHKRKIQNEIIEKLKELDELNKKFKLEINKINGLISELNQIINKKSKEKDIAIRNLADYNNLLTQQQELRKEIEEIENEIERLSIYHEKYIRLKEEEKNLKPKYEEYLKYYDVTEEKIRELERQKIELEKEIEEIMNKVREYYNTDLTQKIRDIEKRIQEIKGKENKLRELDTLLAKIETAKQKIKQNEEEIKKLTDELQLLNFDPNRFQQIKREKEVLEKILGEINSKKGELLGKKEVLENDIKRLEEQIKDYEEKLKNKQKLITAYDKLKKLREHLAEDKLQAYLMNTVKSLVEDSLNSILSRFELSFTRVEVDFNDKNGIYAYTTSGQRLPVNLLSGGERVSIALALRLAIAKSLMNEVGFLILDEPTVNLDEYRKKELIDIIRSTVEVVPQIIVVTHDEELLQAGDYIIRLEKRGDSSKVEVINND
ncbi:DNA double-strand break repair ATPase Rad50 [Sulfurisphaera tokodaii]|uniref:DNA double-strand break repair Rad50 ATPase n=2 Tax=Sulfurisphaera tokodaii TaxID=111955 RepID=RAD50_SULTO|nr:DNA double-strand break repair ATPase Rad50 [Sulfurisphaera tokodaii]Q96YR5.2 RecName: Full=DNA double-strand break repair Rad50 ATPase [Sulfurisphaera tokodaii str. 7]BAK54735.1 DNA double-strand break repair ATPase Rad50 [Sulfurisphaera tokodaii str. 7]HII72941.1 AAA family ATPase [Sulfurisphaera tokodaii]